MLMRPKLPLVQCIVCSCAFGCSFALAQTEITKPTSKQTEFVTQTLEPTTAKLVYRADDCFG